VGWYGGLVRWGGMWGGTNCIKSHTPFISARCVSLGYCTMIWNKELLLYSDELVT